MKTPKEIHDADQTDAAMRDFARRVAKFYVELLEHGIGPVEALSLTRVWMDAVLRMSREP